MKRKNGGNIIIKTLDILAEIKMPQRGVMQALYATPSWACVFMYFMFWGMSKVFFWVGGN